MDEAPSRTVDAQGPLTFGQLSVARDIQSWPPATAHEANLGAVWPVPAGMNLNALRAAIGQLVIAHDSLRTTYDLGTSPIQLVHSEMGPAVTAMEWPGDPADFLAATRLQPFALQGAVPARFDVLTRSGKPSHLVFIAHHIVADGYSFGLIRRGWTDLGQGRGLAAATAQPLSLSAEQWGTGWSGQRRRAEEYLTDLYCRVTDARVEPPFAPHPGGPAQVKLISAELCDVVAALAARHAVSEASILSAAVLRALHREIGLGGIVCNFMWMNRHLPQSQVLVSSMNQFAPVLIDDEHYTSGDLGAVAMRLNWDAIRAFRNGCYDVDMGARVKASASAGKHAEMIFNYVDLRDYSLPDAELAEQIIVQPPTRRGGFACSVQVLRYRDGLALIIRVNRFDVDADRLTCVARYAMERAHAAAGNR